MGEIRDFRLPDLGEGLEEAELVEWLVAVGDHVELNQPVAEVETAKATVAVPSPFAGVVVECLGAVGDEIAVGEVLVRVEVTDPADAGAGDDADGQPRPAVGDAGDGPAQASRDAEVRSATRTRRRVEEPPPLVGYGSRHTSGGDDGGGRRSRGAPTAPPDEDAPVLAKPPVRHLARQLGVELARIAPGSGPDGVVTEEDVLAAAHRGDPDDAGAAAVERPGDGFRGRRAGDVEAIRGVRRRIVEKMERSRREIPDAASSVEVDVTGLLTCRDELVAEAVRREMAVRLTPTVLVMRAVTIALRRTPMLNARVHRDGGGEGHGEIALLDEIHLGVAVDTPRGLVVPNVKHADRLAVWELAEAVEDLAARARAGSLRPEELSGGTFTLNNYGAFGVDDGDPILNHPEAGILGVGAIRRRPWVVGDDVVARHTARFTLSFDHRACDGAEAARFLTDVTTACREPSRLLLDG